MLLEGYHYIGYYYVNTWKFGKVEQILLLVGVAESDKVGGELKSLAYPALDVSVLPRLLSL